MGETVCQYHFWNYQNLGISPKFVSRVSRVADHSFPVVFSLEYCASLTDIEELLNQPEIGGKSLWPESQYLKQNSIFKITNSNYKTKWYT